MRVPSTTTLQTTSAYAVAEVAAGEGEAEAEADELACAVVGVESDSEPDHIFGVCLFHELSPTNSSLMSVLYPNG